MSSNIFLFIAIVFIFTFLVGRLLEKVKIPWIFGALILGVGLAFNNPFSGITNSNTFNFLAQLGMYLLLFIIGLEIDLDQLKSKSGFIFRSTFFIISFEAIFGALLIHFVFSYSWLVSFLVALSFATVGEGILVPILDEFKMINTRLGQSIIGIGTMDDIIEVAMLIAVVALTGLQGQHNIILILSSLALLFIMIFAMILFRKEGKHFAQLKSESLFLLAMFVFFIFVGIGHYADSEPLAALLAGIAFKNFLPARHLDLIKDEIRIIAYGFFTPLFFLWVGSAMNIHYLVNSFGLVLLVVLISGGLKIIGSLLMGKKELGTKGAALLGLGLSVRFSTSIIIIKILFDNQLIGSDLYSIIVASSIFFTFFLPILFSHLLVKWKSSFNQSQNF
ncbi:MAG: cation:proton antiporter [Candidatus Buchananbacteria bacterium]|nr:cation:proton antiporter [Candidatus Buchananbacteria bacterium]